MNRTRPVPALVPATVAATVLLLVAAAPAGAFGLYFDLGGAVLDPDTSDTVTLNVLLDAGPGEQGIDVFSVGVVATAGVVSYDAGLSSNPSYVLYSPPAGATPASYLVPTQSPFQTWPAPLPGTTQVNVAYQEVNLGTTQATGTGILLATLVFHVADGEAPGSIALSLSAPGTFFRRFGVEIFPPIDIVLGEAVTIVPEPGTAVLLGLGLAALGFAGRRPRAPRAAVERPPLQ